MSDTNYPASLACVLKVEGGFVFNKNDPGGATNEGVTQAVYNAFRRKLGQAVYSVKLITPAEVNAIYKQQYWQEVHGADLWVGLDYTVFDEAVNSGVVKSIKDLQTVLKVPADGHFGMITYNAMRSVNDRAAFINQLCDLRLNWLHRLLTWRFFGKGWKARVETVRANALRMVAAPAS